MTSNKKPDKKPEDDFQWKKVGRHLLVAIGIFIILFSVTNYMGLDERYNLQYYKELVNLVEKGVVKNLDFYETSGDNPAVFKGEFTTPQEYKNPTTGITHMYRYFEVNWPAGNEQELEKISNKVNIRVLAHETNIVDYFISLIPWIIIFILFFVFTRRMQSGMGSGKSGGLFSIGKVKAQVLDRSKIKTTFKDVAGADEAKRELEEVVDFLKTPEKYRKLGGKIPKGVLLTGSPGTGKTLLARAVAGEAGVPFFSISGSDFVEMFVGVGASRVRDLFEQARRNAPCIVFVDEIDAVGRQRGVGLGGGNDEREQTLNALLVEMDGFDAQTGIIIMAATNRPDVLDTALLRPGRFDRRVVVELPDIKGREGIFAVHTKEISLGKDIDLRRLATGTPGFSGADIANLVNEAALLAARYDKDVVEMEDFELAKDKVVLGLERKSLIMRDKDKLATAYHESGHTILGKLIKGQDPVYKVTIIPRGFALGVTWAMPQDDIVTHSEDYLRGKIAMLLGGRVAEKVKFKHVSSGAGNDIEKATEIARRMVCEFGMSDLVGPLHFKENGQESFTKAFSEKTAEEIDSEVRRIVVDAEKEATKILKKNIKILDTMADELYKRETLLPDEIDKILAGKPLDEFVKKEKRTDRDRISEIEKIKEEHNKEEKKGESEMGLGNEIPVV